MKKSLLLLLLAVLSLAICACEKGGKEETVVTPTEKAVKAPAVTADPTEKQAEPSATVTLTPTSTPTPTEPVSISLELWCDVTEDDARRYAFEAAAIDMVQKHPEIEFSWYALDSEEYRQKLEYAKDTGELPDIFLAQIGEEFVDSAGRGRLYCLDEAYKAFSDSLPRKACDAVTVNGSLYGIPCTVELYCMYVNTDLLSEAGYDKVPSTYLDLIECCAALHAKGITPFAFCGDDAEYVAAFLESMIEKTCGGRTLSAICNGTAGWKNGEVAGAVNAFRYLMANGYFGGEYLTNTYSAAKEQFLQGKAAFFLDSSKNAGEHAAIGSVKASEFPVLNKQKSASGQLIGETENILVVSAESAHPDVAAQFAYEFAKLVSKYDYLSENNIPAWKVDYEDPEVDLLLRSITGLANDAKYTIPYADAAMGSAEAERFRQECVKMLNEAEFDGITFVRDMSGQDIPDGTLVVFDPMKDSGGSAEYDPSRDLHDMEIIIGDWWSGDVDLPPSTYEENVRADYLTEMMERHHFTIARRTVCGWADQMDSYALSILTNEPLAEIMAVDYRFFGNFLYDGEKTLIADVSKLPEFDFSDGKWNQQIRQSMTVGTAIYGFTTEDEPGMGIFWNKNLVEQILGKSEVDRIYDLQASGEWTWDAFREFVQACTRDLDADGTTDIYGLAPYQSVFFEAAVLSNGHQFVGKDADGRYVNNTTSEDIIADCNWAYSFYEDGLARRRGSDDNWDYYWNDFHDQKAVIMIAEEYYSNYMFEAGDDEIVRQIFDFGFACFPKGPNADDYVSVSKEIIYVIPNCEKTQERLNDIAFAYNIYTNVPPELEEDPGAWKLPYESILEKRAVDETLNMMLHGGIATPNLSLAVPGLWNNDTGPIQTDLLYLLDGADMKPAERLKAANGSIQSMVDDFNNMYLK